MSIYTKSGDKGETGLLGGKRISKSSLRIEAIGNVDELNGMIGVLSVYKKEVKGQKSKVKSATQKLKVLDFELCKQIQNDLFVIGMELADSTRQETKRSSRVLKINASIDMAHIKFLEKYIDALEKKLPKLKNFILPAGTHFAAHAHLARAICRRAERTVVALHEKEPLNKDIIIYLNRLSDLLFMLAREDLYNNKIPEIPWESP